jgi:uncharacterized caspase-like protein
MKANMAKDEPGQDLAVILFSGHGAMIDDRFYLLPYGVDARTPADLKASAISANDFHDEVAELAKPGRVLVLLDACHSGGRHRRQLGTDVESRIVAFDNCGQQRDGADVLHQKRILPRRRKVEQWRIHQSAARRIRQGCG